MSCSRCFVPNGISRTEALLSMTGESLPNATSKVGQRHGVRRPNASDSCGTWQTCRCSGTPVRRGSCRWRMSYRTPSSVGTTGKLPALTTSTRFGRPSILRAMLFTVRCTTRRPMGMDHVIASPAGNGYWQKRLGRRGRGSRSSSFEVQLVCRSHRRRQAFGTDTSSIWSAVWSILVAPVLWLDGGARPRLPGPQVLIPSRRGSW